MNDRHPIAASAWRRNALVLACSLAGLLAVPFAAWAADEPGGPPEAIEEGFPSAAEEGPAEVIEEEVLSTPSTFEAGAAELDALSVESRPAGARVFVDGEDRGTTPLVIADLEPGTHEVILYLSGLGAFRQTVEGRVGRIFVDLESEKGLGMGLVAVETDPSDVRVDVDGRRIGLSPIEFPLEAGRHTLRLSKDGYKELEESLDVDPEGSHAVKVALRPLEGAVLVISSPAGAEVLLDGKSVGTATEPLRVEDVPPGTHAVRVQKDGYRPWEKEDLRVRSGETATVLAALLPERDYSWVRLFTEPAGVRVWVDGNDMGIAGEDGLGFKASKGAHSLRLEADPVALPGYQPLRVTVNFTEDEVDYREKPLRLPQVDQNFTQAQALIERGQKEEALSFLGRVPPDHPNYGEARLLMVELLKDLGRTGEIPAELQGLLERPEYRGNPVLNTALGYWSLVAARDAGDAEAVDLLGKGLEALDRALQAVELFPADQRDALVLRAYYFAGISSEILFNLTGEKKYVKKGSQAWEIFFARLELSPRALENDWIEKARNHRRTLEFLGKKLGG